MAELAALEDPKVLEVNRRHGDAHGVNLGQLRALAKRLGTQQDLARELWATGDTSARLLAILTCRPRAFDRDELDAMVREARTPKVHDWLVSYVVRKSPYCEELRAGLVGRSGPGRRERGLGADHRPRGQEGLRGSTSQPCSTSSRRR